MEVTGKIISFLPEKSGVSQTTGKSWVTGGVIIDMVTNNPQYPKKLAVRATNDRLATLKQFPVGSDVKISFDPESREYNGNWYTDINMWKVEAAANAWGGQAPFGGQQPMQGAAFGNGSVPANAQAPFQGGGFPQQGGVYPAMNGQAPNPFMQQ